MFDFTELSKVDFEIASSIKKCTFKLLEDEYTHFGQLAILKTLKGSGPCNQCTLSKNLHNSPASITVSLKRLEKAGYIKKKTVQTDLRNNMISLTDEGLAAANRADEILYQINIKKFDGFTEEEFAQFVSLKNRVNANLISYKNQLCKKE